MAESDSMPFMPRSCEASQLGNFDYNAPLGENWEDELWAALLDVQLLILDLGRRLPIVVEIDQAAPFPSNETLEVHKQNLDKLPAQKTAVTITDIISDLLLNNLFLDNVWKPIHNCVCGIEFREMNMEAYPAYLVVLDLIMLHVVFLTKSPHIALLIERTRTADVAGKPRFQELVNILKEMASYVDQMSSHLNTEENLQFVTKGLTSEQRTPPTNIGKTINVISWKTYMNVAGFDMSSMHRYISLRTAVLLLCLIHVTAGVMIAYLRWRLWIPLSFSMCCNLLIQYCYFASFDPSMKSNDTTFASLRMPEQIYAVHALLYAYCNLTMKESVYLVFSLGGALVLHRFLEHWVLQHRFAQFWQRRVYDAMIIHFVICGIHLHHGWLALAVGSWLVGSLVQMTNFHALIKFGFVWSISTVDVPAIYLVIYLFTSVSVFRIAGSFLYQFFTPLVVEVILKRVMDAFGGSSSPIDLSGSVMRGIINVLMTFWGFSGMQAFSLMMVMQFVSSLRAIAPQYGMT